MRIGSRHLGCWPNRELHPGRGPLAARLNSPRAPLVVVVVSQVDPSLVERIRITGVLKVRALC